MDFFGNYAATCPHRIELEVPRRRANALNIEVGTPLPRCARRLPERWPEGSSAVRWLWSGGSALVFSHCGYAGCPLKKKSE